jgi:phage repressor protein C with HTH and peptisase S24 domain
MDQSFVVSLTRTLNVAAFFINPNMNSSAYLYSITYSSGMTIGIRLQEAMHRADIKSQSELARRSGVPQPTINRVLNRGGRHGPAMETLKRLAAACGVPLQWLADGTGAELPGVSCQGLPLGMPARQANALPAVSTSARVDQAVGPVSIRRVTVHASLGPTEFTLRPDENVGDAVYVGRAWQRSRGYDDRMLIALAMTGESMAPGLYDGDTLIVNLADITPSDGEVFLLSYEGMVLVRRLIRDAGKWWLSADNSDQRRFRRKQYSSVECKIIGRVVYRSSEKL